MIVAQNEGLGELLRSGFTKSGRDSQHDSIHSTVLTDLSGDLGACPHDGVLGHFQMSGAATKRKRVRRQMNVASQYIKLLCKRFQLTMSHSQPKHASTTNVSVIRAHQRY